MQNFCLKCVNALRTNDMVGRLGGEEFGIAITFCKPLEIDCSKIQGVHSFPESGEIDLLGLILAK